MTIFTEHGCWPKRKLHLRSAEIRTHKVTLQREALHSLVTEVEACLRRKNIYWLPVSSYRSCKQQKQICEAMCNQPSCPGTCAEAGTSYHQLGLAVDVYIRPGDRFDYRKCFERFGWNNFSGPSGSDPNHWTFHVTG